MRRLTGNSREPTLTGRLAAGYAPNVVTRCRRNRLALNFREVGRSCDNASHELPMKAYEQIGRKLQKAREDAGLSQEELAKKLGCTQASLSNYELGKRRLYLADLQRIGQLLGKPVTYFLEESENDEPIGNELAGILKEPYVKEILLALQDLKPAQRKSVFDYILWQRSGGKER